MLPDTTVPTEILHYAYLNAKIYPIDYPTEIAMLYLYLKLNRVYSYGYLVPSECCILFLKIMYFCIDNVVVLLIYRFYITNNEHNQKFYTMVLVIR
jgi:hypothetical protein